MTADDSHSDDALVRAVISGSKDAFEILVKRYQDRIYGFVVWHLGSADLAKDIAQDVFIRAYRSINSFRGDAAFSSWLIQIAINRIRSYKKSKHVSREPLHTQIDQQLNISSGQNPEESLMGSRNRHRIQEALATLQIEQREVLVLCTVEGYSYSEASTFLKIPLGTVCSRMHVALEKLRIILSKGGVER